MGTPVLRAALVVVALALGLFVLSKAFPTGGAPETVTPVQPVDPTVSAPLPQETQSVPPSPGGGKGGQGDGELKQPGQLSVQILNGTFESGLAAETQKVFEDAGYDVLTTGDAQGKPYEVTQINYLPGLEANAQQIADQFFPGAKLSETAKDAEVDITVVLGEDYVAAQGGGGGGGEEEAPAEEESPAE